MHLHAGEFAAASALNEEADAITEATGNAPAKYSSLLLSAWRGVEAESLAFMNWGLENVRARGEGRGIGGYGYGTAVLYNGLGRYEAALAGARLACEYDDLGIFGFALGELVEAGARSGAHEEAAAALRQLEQRTTAAGTDWALGVQAWSRALLSDGETADSLYREAIERLERTRIAVISPARTWCTENGCVARTGASTRVSTFDARTTCSPGSGPRRLPSAPVASSAQQARPRAVAPTRRAAC